MIESRHEQDKRLHEPAERFRALIENVPEITMIVSANGIIAYATPSSRQILGRPPDEMAGQYLPDLIHPDDVRSAMTGMDRISREPGGSASVELRIQHRNGSWRWMEGRLVNLTDNPAVQGYIWSCHDITGHKHAENALHRRLSLEECIVTVSSRFVGITDTDAAIEAALADMGRLRVADRSYIFLFRADGETMDNTHEWCAEGVNPQKDNLQDLRSDDFPWWMSKLRNGETIHVPDIAQMPDEASAEKAVLESQDIRSLLVIPLLIGGELGGFIGFDSTAAAGEWNEDDLRLLKVAAGLIGSGIERKRREDALKESEEKLAGIVSSIVDNMTMVDEDFTIVWANDVVERNFGPKVVGSKCYRIYHKRDSICEPCWAARTFATGHIHQHETELIDDRGNRRVFWSISSPAARYPDGRPRLVVEISRDITERKLAEEEITRKNQELRKALSDLEQAQKEIENSHAQLLQSEKLAAVGQLVSGVAHELNNPLMGIMSSVELMQRYADDDMLLEDLKNIEVDADRAVSIVRNLLSFARKQEPTRVRVSINKVIESVIELRAYELRLENVGVVTELAPSLPDTMADFQQLQQVFLNLIINAEQAIRETNGGGRITIRTGQNGNGVRATLTDDGPGIPGDIVNRIFEPFFTTKGVGKGTGLGLSICYGIVRDHQGSIDVESEPGHGAMFIVDLPAVREEPLSVIGD